MKFLRAGVALLLLGMAAPVSAEAGPDNGITCMTYCLLYSNECYNRSDNSAPFCAGVYWGCMVGCKW